MVAEVAVATVILKAVSIAANPLIQAGNRVLDLAEYIQWIETKMRSLQSYLKDAESKKATSHEAANLIISIRDLALDVEDILNKYLPQIESHNTSGRIEYIKHASCIFCYSWTAYKFVSEIEAVKRRAAEIEIARTNSAVIAHIGGERRDVDTIWDLRKSFIHAKVSNIFGRGEILQKMEVEMLSTDPQCRIISLVGPAGVGKTTVGKRIYKRIKNEFQCSAIVYVSKEPKVGELLVDIARQVGLSEDKIKQNLEENLCSWLEQKRYVVFLDDIWNSLTWDRLKHVFPTDSLMRSRIIVSSRYDDVGRYIGGHRSLVKLDHLSKSEGWELFCDLISINSEEPLQPALADIGRKIVDRCGGLPLAIVVAVGMVKQRERLRHTWNEVLENMRETADDDCLKILALSFQDLPIELKPFFLYFGLFPEDHELFVSELAQAWVAEKFIPANDHSRNPRDIAESKVYKLIDRNLIQVASRRWDGRIRSCRIHDVLQDLCIKLAEEHNFCRVLNDLESSSLSFASIGRRITTHDSKYIENFRTPPTLRSLFCFNQDEEVSKSLKRNCSNWRFLRLLVIEGERNHVNLPNEITNVSSLSYLKLKGYMVSIPPGISKLGNLVTLDVSFNDVILPWSIWKMKHLKNLLLKRIWAITTPSPMCMCDIELPNLETLSCFYWEEWSPRFSKKLPKLRKLHVNFDPKEILEVVSFTELLSGTLEVLHLETDAIDHEPTRKINLSHLQRLVKLRLKQIFIRGSLSVEFPLNLTHITLEDTNIKNDLMESLKKLPRLELLKLKNCTAGEETFYLSTNIGILDFSGENSFSQLQVLVISNSFIQELKVDEKGLPKIEKIIFRSLDSSFQLKFPERLGTIMVIETDGGDDSSATVLTAGEDDFSIFSLPRSCGDPCADAVEDAMARFKEDVRKLIFYGKNSF